MIRTSQYNKKVDSLEKVEKQRDVAGRKFENALKELEQVLREKSKNGIPRSSSGKR